MGFERPSAIQEEALPRNLNKDKPRNLIGQAQSGNGKTTAFIIGMLYPTTINPNESITQNQVLCVTPTRKLRANRQSNGHTHGFQHDTS